MICSKCAALNNDDDRYCYHCGSELIGGTAGADTSGFDADGYPINNGTRGGRASARDDFEANDDLGLSIESNSALAIRDAKRVDISNMRPITRVAYQIESSEKAGSISTFMSVLFFIICIGMVVCLIALFQSLQVYMQTYGGSATAEYSEKTLSDIYKTASTTGLQTVLWLAGGFVALLLSFIVVGKIVLRSKKVRRKKKNKEIDEF